MYSFCFYFSFWEAFLGLEMEEKGESGLNPLYGSMRAVQAQSVHELARLKLAKVCYLSMHYELAHGR